MMTMASGGTRQHDVGSYRGNVSVTVPGSASCKVSTSTTLGSKDVKVPDEAQAANVIDLHTEAGDVSLQQQ